MRLPFNSQPMLEDVAVVDVDLNTNCRDEIIPILRALQYVYADARLRTEILALIEQDVNRTTSRKRGRRGLDYWEITVLASVRLGCNLDYDKLQDLAENHRRLRQIMGISDWDEKDRQYFRWQRIEANINLLGPETLEKINHLIVAAGHKLVPDAVESVRGDTFVVETNIHYPTDSSLIGDGLRKLVEHAVPLAKQFGIAGWRQYGHLLKKLKKQLRLINKTSRSKGKYAKDRIIEAYKPLFHLADDLLQRVQQLVISLAACAELLTNTQTIVHHKAVLHFLPLTQKVLHNGKRRVLHGETIANEEKIFSIFEPHTELIRRGKTPNPNQFGHSVLVIEDDAGFVCHYEVLINGTQDQDVVIGAMQSLQQRVDGKIKHASFDRGFHNAENQEKLKAIVEHPCLAKTGKVQPEESTVEFRRSRQHHPGVESAIGALQSGNGQRRCRDRSYKGYKRYVGLGILGRNLHTLGRLLIAQEKSDCQAAKTKRTCRRCKAA